MFIHFLTGKGCEAVAIFTFCMFLPIRGSYIYISVYVLLTKRVVTLKCVPFLTDKGRGTVALFTFRMFLPIRGSYIYISVYVFADKGW